MSFDLNPELSQAIHRLQEVIIQDDDEDSELAGMVDISKVYVVQQHSLTCIVKSRLAVRSCVFYPCWNCLVYAAGNVHNTCAYSVARCEIEHILWSGLYCMRPLTTHTCSAFAGVSEF